MRKTLFAALLTCILVSCAPNVAITLQATVTATVDPTPLPTFTPPPFIALPTSPDLPLVTVTPTQTPLPAVLPKFPLDGYVMLFKEDGDLYFQDGENTPVKLTHVGEPNYKPYYPPRLSDDNQKVIFSQNDGNIYSINIDGTEEQVIIPSNWSDSLETGTRMGVLKFVPQTHFVFFEGLLCKEESSASLCSTTIFLVDADTGKTNKLADLGIALQNHAPTIQDNIRFSPDGKMVAVGTMDGVKIFTLDGKIIRQNILPFKPSKSETPFPSLFWLPDSSGLIVALPDTIVEVGMWGYTAAYTIWRYSLNDNSTVQIPFDPPIVGKFFEVSPDGNWIAYYGGLPESPYYLYLGNLANGKVRAFGNAMVQQELSWNPNSKYFILGWEIRNATDNPPLFDHVLADSWIDANHFVRADSTANNPIIKQDRTLIAEIKGNEISYYELGFPSPPYRFLLIKPK